MISMAMVGFHQSVMKTGSALERSSDHQWKEKHVVVRTGDGLVCVC